MINIGIIEDEGSVRENLQIFLNDQNDINVVQAAASVESFLESYDKTTPIDTLLLDIRLPGMSGLEGMRHIKNVAPEVDILILSAYDDSDTIFKALCGGAVSYISKRTELSKIKEAIISVNRGGAYMSPSIARKVITHFSPKPKKAGDILTARQEQIVQGLVDGLSYKMIADKYLISVETVRDHIKKIYKKLQVNSKAEVIRKKLKGEI